MSFRFGNVSHLKACKSIKASFNPWIPGSKSIRFVFNHLKKYSIQNKEVTKFVSFRQFFHILFNPKLRNTNEKCKIQVDVRSDVVEPHLEVIYSKISLT